MIKGKGEKRLYTTRETCERLQICEKTLYRWINRGVLKPIRHGGTKKAGRLLFTEKQINKLLER